ncbi:hypothetical protein CTI12_AA453560 [Artemisia annua]|uniref:RPN1 N-terminal domain-containing protein n=1 Tax=Artemisia annua TaxID=35608 RepID=A0A2U1LR32_ARTAN|nr:hypothetical protein CTI12_AA453560 [Artemisia annua]
MVVMVVDLALKQQLELYVERVQDADPALQKVALESMSQEIRTSTSSMTSVPKPLKFLRPHYGTLKSFYESMPESDLKKLLADTLSVLALTMSADGEPQQLELYVERVQDADPALQKVALESMRAVVPILQGYEDAGDFTVTERLKTSLHVNLMFYVIVGSVALFGLIFLILLRNNWAVVPILQGYEDAGDFTVTERLKTSLHVNLMFYVIVGSVALFGLIFLILLRNNWFVC